MLRQTDSPHSFIKFRGGTWRVTSHNIHQPMLRAAYAGGNIASNRSPLAGFRTSLLGRAIR